MTDYNDGNWHGWNGGDCPVHPQSEVDYVWHSLRYEKVGVTERCLANDSVAWRQVIRFRVTKPYVEPPKPREIWINEYPAGQARFVYDTADDARRRFMADGGGKTSRWIEVLE